MIKKLTLIQLTLTNETHEIVYNVDTFDVIKNEGAELGKLYLTEYDDNQEIYRKFIMISSDKKIVFFSTGDILLVQEKFAKMIDFIRDKTREEIIHYHQLLIL